MVLLPGCKCCKSGPCWRCYGKYDCGELPDACLCDGKEYSIPDTFKGVLSYDSIEYNPASSLAESEVDFGQLQELLDSGKSGMTFTRSTLLPLGTDPNSWVFNNTPDGSIVPERCGDFSGDISSVSRLDLNCSGPAKPFFNGPGFQASGVGQANYYNTILPNSNGFGVCDWGVFHPSGEIEYSICDAEILTITIEGTSRAQIADCLYQFGTTASSYAVYSLVNAKFTFTIPLIIEGQLGTCCLPTGDCSITTHQECADQCGIWTQDATCEDNPCEPVEAEEYRCFDAQPTEDGWIATGDCHPDEPSCAAECPPTTTTIGARTMSTTTKTTGGPGTELKRLLGSFGIQSKEKGCGCRSMQKKMDKPGWAVSHKKEIVDHLAAEAKKRRLPFIRLAAEKLVDLAIRRAEKK